MHIERVTQSIARIEHSVGGRFSVRKYRKGELVETREFRNMVVDNGLNLIGSLPSSSGFDPTLPEGNNILARTILNRLALGTDDTPVLASDMYLGEEVIFAVAEPENIESGSGQLSPEKSQVEGKGDYIWTRLEWEIPAPTEARTFKEVGVGPVSPETTNALFARQLFMDEDGVAPEPLVQDADEIVFIAYELRCQIPTIKPVEGETKLNVKGKTFDVRWYPLSDFWGFDIAFPANAARPFTPPNGWEEWEKTNDTNQQWNSNFSTLGNNFTLVVDGEEVLSDNSFTAEMRAIWDAPNDGKQVRIRYRLYAMDRAANARTVWSSRDAYTQKNTPDNWPNDPTRFPVLRYYSAHSLSNDLLRIPTLPALTPRTVADRRYWKPYVNNSFERDVVIRWSREAFNAEDIRAFGVPGIFAKAGDWGDVNGDHPQWIMGLLPDADATDPETTSDKLAKTLDEQIILTVTHVWGRVMEEETEGG